MDEKHRRYTGNLNIKDINRVWKDELPTPVNFPQQPTMARPGSEEKVAVMEQRF